MVGGTVICPELVNQREIIQGKISWRQKLREQLPWGNFMGKNCSGSN